MLSGKITDERFVEFSKELIPIMDQLLELSGKYPEMSLISVAAKKDGDYAQHCTISGGHHFEIGKSRGNYKVIKCNSKTYHDEVLYKENDPATDQSEQDHQ